MGRVWVGAHEYVPVSEVEKARQLGRQEATRHMRVAFGVTWLLLFACLLFLASASGAYPAGLCGTG